MSFLFSRATHSTKHDALQLALMLRLGSDRSMLLSVEMGSQLLCAQPSTALHDAAKIGSTG